MQIFSAIIFKEISNYFAPVITRPYCAITACYCRIRDEYFYKPCNLSFLHAYIRYVFDNPKVLLICLNMYIIVNYIKQIILLRIQ